MNDRGGDADSLAERAAGRRIQFQSWSDLLFLHWPVPPEAFRGLVPARLSLDLHQGTAYVGAVAFAMRGVRPSWLPGWLSLNCLETNLRTYVSLDGREPGIFFFSLDASSRLVVALARRCFGLPYFFARMDLERRDGSIEYRLRRTSGMRPRLAVRYEVGEDLGPSLPGSLEHFLLERYRFHLARGASLLTCQVRHVPYPVRPARILSLEENLLAAGGLPPPTGLPPLVHYSPGVDVEVLAPVKRDARKLPGIG